jgi:flagellar biosynthesis protein FlhF
VKIKRYTGKSTREVLARIRGDLGPDAVILSNREIVGGVELMAAVDFDASRLQAEPDAPEAPPVPPRVAAPAATPAPAPATRLLPARVLPPLGAGKPSPRQQTVAAPATPGARRAPEPARAEAGAGQGAAQAGAQAAGKPGSQTGTAVWAGELRDLRSELEALRDWVHASVARAPVGSASALELRLQALGLDAESARELGARFAAVRAGDAAGATGDPLDACLDDWLSGLPLPREPMAAAGVYALVGATGVGKTTTIAKIAARLVLQHGTDAVALVTTDTYRIGGAEQLRIYGRILGVPVAVARDAAELRANLQAFGERRYVLIDTIGLSPRDARLGEQLQWLRELGAAVRPLLLLSAGMSPAVYEQAWELYRELPPAGCILTKLDEAPAFASALRWLQRRQLPLWFYTDGQRVPEDLHAPTVAKIKALLQRAPAATRADGTALRPGLDDAAAAVVNSR